MFLLSDNNSIHDGVEHSSENQPSYSSGLRDQTVAQLDRILRLLPHKRTQVISALRRLPPEQQQHLNTALCAIGEQVASPAAAPARKNPRPPRRPAPRISISVVSNASDLPKHLTIARIAKFLHKNLHPYEDTLPDIKRGLSYALSTEPGQGGWIFLAEHQAQLAGALVMLRTGMSGYIPENLLLFVAVDGKMRGCGIGAKLIKKAQQTIRGPIKLHVEHQNPARRLYERMGFSSKYLEMRWQYQPSNH